MNKCGDKRLYDEFVERYPHIVTIAVSKSDKKYNCRTKQFAAFKYITAQMSNILKINFEGMITYIFTDAYDFKKCQDGKNCYHATYQNAYKCFNINLTSIRNNITQINISLR